MRQVSLRRFIFLNALSFVVFVSAQAFLNTAPALFLPFTPPDLKDSHNPFSFIVHGDVQHSYHDGHALLVNQMEKEPSPFILNTGDISPDNGAGYDEYFYPAMKDLARRISFFPVAGNHDVDWRSPYSRSGFQSFFRPAFEYLKTQPDNLHLQEPEGQRLWYSYPYEKALFIVLDSNLFIDTGKYSTTHALEPYRNYGSEQLLWLKDTLEKASKNPDIQTKFVFFHHSPFVTYEADGFFGMIGGHPGHSGMVVDLKIPARGKTTEQYMLDLFRLHGVTAVFTGHEHYYERWREVIYENGQPARVLNWIVNGAGGVKPRGRPEYEDEEIHEVVEENYRGYLDRVSGMNPSWTAKLQHEFPNVHHPSGRFHNYMVVSVDGPEASFVTKDIDGKVRDRGPLSGPALD